MPNDPFVLVTTFIFGTLIGSFLNVVILRLPRPDSSIVFPASHCPVCKADLHWYENIPLISYLLLRGRCGHCRVSISFQYPTVEFLTGIMAAACTAAFGFSYAALGYFIFSAALITIIWIDIQHQIIPDIISLPGIVAGFWFFVPVSSCQLAGLAHRAACRRWRILCHIDELLPDSQTGGPWRRRY